MKKLTLMSVVAVLCLQVNAQETPQDKTITGKVLSASGNLPVEGATLLLQSSKKAVYTDALGAFSLTLTTVSDDLTVSHVGFLSKKISVSQNTLSPLIITLQDTAVRLDEVIVNTGYQKIPKERATGSFVTVNQQAFNDRVSPDVVSRLEGITSSLVFFKGVPNRPDEINIRGQSTLFSNSQPLIVVDNFPYDGDIGSINPNDVESINILKDAAAASIWGVRAGNGVIVITTKKGRLNGQFKISVNSSFTTSEEPDIYYDPRFIPSADFIGLETYLFENGHYNNDFDMYDQRPLSSAVDILYRQQQGILSSAEAQAALGTLSKIDVRTDLQKYFYRRPKSGQYSLSLQGGGEKIAYFLSAGYDNQSSFLVGNSNNRVTIHSFATFKPAKKLTISVGVDHIPSFSESASNVSEILLGGPQGRNLLPYTLLADNNGNALPVIKDYKTEFVDQAQANGFLNWRFNPLQELRNKDNLSTTKSYHTRILSTTSYELIKGLSADVAFQYENAITTSKHHNTGESYAARNMINKFSIVSPSGEFVDYVVPPGGILTRGTNQLSSYSIRGQVNFDRSWGSNNLTGLAGAEARQIRTEQNGDRLYGYNDELATFALVDPTEYFLNYPSETWWHVPAVQDIGSTTDRFRSWYLNLSYSYDSRYILSASGRVDGSNYFGAEANKKNVPLWSSGLRWNVNREVFYKLHWLPKLNLRLTYGYNGNLNKKLTAYMTGIYQGAAPTTNQPYMSIVNPPNKNLRWEKTAMINFGIDFGFNNDIVTGTLEYFRKRGVDIIGENELAPSTGFIDNNTFTNTVKGNYANMKGQGWDLQLFTRNLQGTFQWSSQILFSYSTDLVTSYGGTILPLSLVSFGAGASGFVVPLEGKPVYGLYSLKWAGLDPLNGNPLGYVDDKVSDNYARLAYPTQFSEIEYNGPARPKYYGSFGNTLSYRNLSLFVNITYKFNYYFRRFSVNYLNLVNYYDQNADYLLRWQQPGDEKFTQVPSFTYPADYNRDIFYNSSSILVEKGDHIRLQEISLTYDFKPLSAAKLPFDHIRLYALINNAAILWRANKFAIDPDYPLAIPAPRSYSVGLRATF